MNKLHILVTICLISMMTLTINKDGEGKTHSINRAI